MRYSLLIITYRGLSLSLENDVCMRMFFHSLEGRAFAEFFSCPPKILSTWAELTFRLIAHKGSWDVYGGVIKERGYYIYSNTDSSR